MNAGGSRFSCDDFVTTLQPYVDGELAEVEHRAFAEHVERCDECRKSVCEQQKVRAALRGLVPEFAPALLRERVIADLDAFDAETAVDDGRDEAPLSLASRWRAQASAFVRGGLVLVPAAAAAAFMFLGARHVAPTESATFDEFDDAALASSAAAGNADGREKPGLLAAQYAADRGGTFEIQVPSSHSLPGDVELVAASSASPADPFQARVEYADRSGRVRIIDRQRRGGQLRPPATHRVFRGRHLYYLGRDEQGRAFLEFTVGDVHHRLDSNGAIAAPSDRRLDSAAPDFRALVSLADALGRARGSRP